VSTPCFFSKPTSQPSPQQLLLSIVWANTTFDFAPGQALSAAFDFNLGS